MITYFNLILPASHFNDMADLVLKLSLFLSLKNTWTMPIFHKLFLLSQELDTPSDNPSYLESYTCENFAKRIPSSLMQQTSALPLHCAIS